MATLTINNNTFATSDTSITITFTTDVTPTDVKLTKDGTNWISAKSFTPDSATFDVSNWGKGTYTNCQIKVSYMEDVSPTTYTITKNLSNCSCSNSATSITSGSSYSATISANSGYNLSSLTITMGGTNITSSAVSGSNISINKVTGNIVITASATQQETPSQPNPPSSGSALDDWDVYNNTYSYNYVAYMASQVGVKDKAIRITADKKTVTAHPTGGTGQTTTKDYVSGGLVTKKAFKYGTFTFKCKLSANNTYLWAMIWTLPDSVSMARPEFDLWESWGSKTNNAIVQTYHAFDSAGNDKMNYQQANTPVDLTQEHEVKAVWTQDNVFKMYCDGVLKLTIKDYMVNWETGEVDYQLWFLNLGLGTFANDAPNGTGWMEITDYKFEPVYTRDRVKQHTWCGNWTDGTLPSGPLPSSGGSSSGSGGSTPTTYTITNTLTNCTSNNSAANITANSSYSATISAASGYTLSTLTVTMGGFDITSSAVSGNSINISSVTGDIVITANATETSSGTDPIEPVDSLTIKNISVMSATEANTQIMYVTNKPVTTHYFNMWYSDSDTAFTDGTSKVTDMGNNTYKMTFTNELSAGTKSPAIKVQDAEGNTYIKTFDLTVTN